MKVFVFGSGGDVGEYLLKKLAQEKHEAITMAETANRADELKMVGAAEVYLAKDVSYTEVLTGCDAIIYIAGTSPHAGENKNVLVDHEAIAHALAAARKQQVERIVYLSPARVDESAKSQDTGGKKIPEELMKLEGFSYTIVHASHGAHKPGKGMIDVRASNRQKIADLPFEDIAAVLVEALDNKSTYNKTLKIIPGTTPIKQALKQFREDTF